MELEQLVGPHILSGVDWTTEYLSEWLGEFERASAMMSGVYRHLEHYDTPSDILGYQCEIMVFVLDDIAYAAIEDPDDGYRSMLGALVLADKNRVKNRFPGIAVTARYVDYIEDKYTSYSADLLELVDDHTGDVVLRVGTTDTGDYYPLFVANWNPPPSPIAKHQAPLHVQKIFTDYLIDSFTPDDEDGNDD